MKRKRAIHIRFTYSSPSKANKWWVGCCTLFAVATERKTHLFYPRRGLRLSPSGGLIRFRRSICVVNRNLFWESPLFEDTVLECMNSLNPLSRAGLKIFSLGWHSQYVKLKYTKVHYKEMKRYCKVMSHCSFKPVPLQNDNKNKDNQLF